MNSEKLHEWLQIIAAAAIVVSLIFVGLQLRQSQEIAIAAQYQARLDTLMNSINSTSESETGLRVFGKSLQIRYETDDTIPAEVKAWAEDQPVEELAFLSMQSYGQLKWYDNLHFQYQSGFLDGESWQGMRRELKRQLADPAGVAIFRRVYEYDREVWRTQFRELVDEIITEIDTNTK